MKIKLLALLMALLFAKEISAQGYDQFVWNSSTQGLVGPQFVKFGLDDSLYIGSVFGLHVYADTTINFYSLYPLAGRYAKAISFESGIAWIGTDSGLVKRTGTQLQVFNKSNSGMNCDYINDVKVVGSSIHLATDSGLTIYDGSTWTNISTVDLGLIGKPISIGKNNYGIYLIDGVGKVIVNSGAGWRNVYNPRLGNYQSGRLQSLNNDTLLIPNLAAFVTDSIVNYINIPIDPCIFKDDLDSKGFLFSNPATGENLFTLSKGGLPSSCDYLLKLNNFELDLSDIREFSNTQLSNYISQLSTYGNLFDFNSSGKMYWVANSLSRRIFSVNLSLDSFPLQVPFDDCPYLDINQVRARVWNNGTMFWDLTGEALYEVPKGSGKTAIFGNGLWIGGLDQSNQLHIAAQTYRQSGSDFWPGPLDTVNATIDSATHAVFDTIWKINRSTIDDFIWRYATGQVQNGSWTVPDIILNWPAHGSGNYSHDLAPYYDFNQDGNYNPYDGDYPDVKGSQMIWSVFNDNFGFHDETNSDRNLGIEIQMSAYAYNCPMAINDDSVINYTTFYHYDIINRSDTDYHDVYLGVFTDVDLGNYLDDYVGCDTVNDFGFAYNGDDNDDGLLGYGLNPPMINNVILEGPEATLLDGVDNDHDGTIDELEEKCMMNNFTYWNNDASNIGNPTTALHHYYRVKSQWLDGLHVTLGGNGYNPSSQDYTNYMFSATPYSGQFWSESVPNSTGSTPNTPDDRRFLISSGPFNLDAHQKKSIDFAYVYTRDPRYPNGLTTSIAKNTQDVLRIKQFYESNTFPCDNVISVEEIEDLQLGVFPNPADQYIDVVFHSKGNSEKQLQITDLLGQIIFTKKINSERSIRIATDNFAAGLYFINVASGINSSTKKFVVQHSN